MIDCAFLTFDQTVKVEIIQCISEVNDFHKCLRLKIVLRPVSTSKH